SIAPCGNGRATAIPGKSIPMPDLQLPGLLPAMPKRPVVLQHSLISEQVIQRRPVKNSAMIARDELKAYFDKARRFDQDRMIQVERSARIAWSVAIVAGVLAGVSIFAVAGLTPLKTVEPFVVRVDNSTGIVDVVSALTSTPGTYDEA